MKIYYARLKPREFGFRWIKDRRVLVIGLYFFGLMFDVGERYRKKVWSEANERILEGKRALNRKCLVCQKPLPVNSRKQVVYYHKECRKNRKKVII